MRKGRSKKKKKKWKENTEAGVGRDSSIFLLPPLVIFSSLLNFDLYSLPPPPVFSHCLFNFWKEIRERVMYI